MRKVKKEMHYLEKSSEEIKRPQIQAGNIFGAHFMDYNSTFSGHMECVKHPSDTIAMEPRESTTSHRVSTQRRDPLDEEGRQHRSYQPLSLMPRRETMLQNPLEASVTKELLAN